MVLQCLLLAAIKPCVTVCRDCWSVAFGNSFNDEERCVLAGYDNGDVKLFDLCMNKVLNWSANFVLFVLFHNGCLIGMAKFITVLRCGRFAGRPTLETGCVESNLTGRT